MKITFIGGGNMASAMIGGMVKQGFTGNQIHVIDPNEARRALLESEFGISTAEPGSALPASDAVIFAIKPQQFRAVAEAIRPTLGNALVISVAAGIRAETLSRLLSEWRMRCWIRGEKRIWALIETASLQNLAGGCVRSF